MTSEQDRIATEITRHHITKMRESVINLCSVAGVPMKTIIAILCAELVKEIVVMTASMVSALKMGSGEKYHRYTSSGKVLVNLLQATFNHASEEDFVKIEEQVARAKS